MRRRRWEEEEKGIYLIFEFVLFCYFSLLFFQVFGVYGELRKQKGARDWNLFEREGM